MEVFGLHTSTPRPISEFNSHGASVMPVAASAGFYQLVHIHLEPGGVLGMHQAASDQLFIILEGSGTVIGADKEPTAVSASEVVFWGSGEFHETKAGDLGLRAIVFETEDISARILLRKRDS